MPQLFKKIHPQKTGLLQKCICPYWETDSWACMLVNDGLYIPVKSHVAAYCNSRRHPSCYYYELFAGAENSLPQEPTLSINRRRSLRVPLHYSFSFFEITENHHVRQWREHEALTIDLSEHGLSCAGLEMIPPLTPIHFLIEADETDEQFAGVGRVIWSKPIGNKTFFHSGIAFNSLNHDTATPGKLDSIGPRPGSRGRRPEK